MASYLSLPRLSLGSTPAMRGPEPQIRPGMVTISVEKLSRATHAYAQLINWQQVMRRGSNIRTVQDMENAKRGADGAREMYLRSIEGLSDEQRSIVIHAFHGNLAGSTGDVWKQLPDPVTAEWIAWKFPPFISEFV